MLLPQLEDFAAGVAWYGFPNAGDLSAPRLILHRTADEPSPVADYAYATTLDEAAKPFEKVYQGEPHGFMLQDGQLRDDAGRCQRDGGLFAAATGVTCLAVVVRK